MEGDRGDVQVSVDSSWTVLKGSLETCVSVVFLDPETHDPIISSSPRPFTKLVLEPPAEPVPCEITVKFRGGLCHVQSLYTSSTSRICEIYSRSKLEADPEYICTVKGWIPCKDNFSTDEGTELGVPDPPTKRGDDMERDSMHESSVASSRVASILVDDEYEKSVYSSGDDSWVNVKLSGSSSAESACVSLTAPDLDNWHVPLNAEELVLLEDQLALGSEGNGDVERGLENHTNLSDRPCQGKAPKEKIGPGNSGHEMYEAEVELIDHDPWAAITIRLLSLQNKSVVEVDQMVFLVIAGPVPELAPSTCQSDGRGGNSALFAMFLPSILQMARGVPSNGKDLLKNEKCSQVCEQEQDMVDELHRGKDNAFIDKNCCLSEFREDGRDAILESCASEFREDVPVMESTMPSVQNDASCDASKIDEPFKLEEVGRISSHEEDADRISWRRTTEQGGETLLSGSNSNAMCDCKEVVHGVIAKELTATFEAFSERFDKLELLCLRMESFLHKSFERLDERITHLELQHRKDFAETDCVSKHLGTSYDASVQQTSQSNNQVLISPSSLENLGSKEEIDSVQVDSDCTDSSVKVHSEMQHAVKEEPAATSALGLKFINAVNPVEEVASEVQESSECEVTMVSKCLDDTEPVVSLEYAWATALSAFASSFSPVVAESETALLDEQSLGFPCNDSSTSKPHHISEFKEVENASSSSSHFDHRLVAPNDEDSKLINSDRVPTHGGDEEPTCTEQEGRDSLLRSQCMTSIPAMAFDCLDLREASSTPDQQKGVREEPAYDEQISIAREESGTLLPGCSLAFDFLDFREMKSTPFQKVVVGHESNNGLEYLKGHSGSPELNKFPKELPSVPDGLDVEPSNFPRQQEAQFSSPLFDMFSSAHSNSVISGETLDDWAAMRGSKVQFSPAESQDAPENSPPYNSSLFAEDLQYGFSQETIPSKAHVVWQRSSSGNSHAEKSDEGSLSNAFLELDFLSGQVLNEQGEGLNVSEVPDFDFLKKCFMYSTAEEEASSFPDLCDDSSNYQDGRTCSQDSMCFSQDFDGCRNDENRWSSAPNVFYLNDPELTDDEADNGARGSNEVSELSGSILQGDLSDTDSAQDLPFWPPRQGAREDEQLTTTVFPGFENLC